MTLSVADQASYDMFNPPNRLNLSKSRTYLNTAKLMRESRIKTQSDLSPWRQSVRDMMNYYIDGNMHNMCSSNVIQASYDAIRHLRHALEHVKLAPDAQRAFCRGFDLGMNAVASKM